MYYTADRQNIQSASIAAKGVIELFKTAFGDDSEQVKDLNGQVLVFTVSHDNDRICMYGHYAANTEADELLYHRHQIALLSLSAKDGADKYIPRIQERTNLSFSASVLALEDAQSQYNSQETQSQDDSNFKTPGLPASSMHKKNY